jgi:hypothetical protein
VTAGTGSPADPWKGLRGIMAGTLFMQAIVVALALLVVAKLDSGVSGAAGWIVGLLALAMLTAAFVQRRPWGLPIALALQAAMIACWPLVPALGALGLIFALVWIYLLWLRRDLARRISSAVPGDQAASHTEGDAS